ncbi:hypothetical protein [Sphingomicrobium astaxanthinifaciens]|uniref:hypothetical protein n=1 Tax=Sphingomicrobium astaxanthinifaciens TaxID=1227949 RepID=UPI001FCAC4D4|nr:hypothetical protein [Sphingomicrobium astaxanthinifaciens]MCJ7421422.1 hypothetical protein [Sphingomicrobium astaxanthinifaciens]
MRPRRAIARRLVPGLALLAAGVAGAASAAGAAPSAYERPRDGVPVMEALVSAEARDAYRLRLDLHVSAPVWIFLRSGRDRATGASWRAGSWRVLTEGVRLARIGHHEALVTVDGGALPSRVEIAFAPFEGLLESDYQPALRLGPDSTALFSDHFTLRPAPSVGAVQALGADWTMLPDYAGGHPLVRFEGRDFHHGGRHGSFAVPAAAYVLHGPAAGRTTDQLVMRVDPAVPGWLADQLEEEIPAILAYYAARLGPHEDERPELLVGWAGATPGRVRLGGSVVANQVVMQLEGAPLLAPSPLAAARARQFIAHEAAHFWLGNLVGYGPPGAAWTSEGGADLMALRATQAVDPDGAAALGAATLRASWDECVQLGGGGPLAAAPERGADQAFYGCGFLFGLVAEAAARRAGGDFFDFWSALIARSGDDGTVSAPEWLDHHAAIGGPPEATALMRAMAFSVPVTAARLEALFAAAGLAPPRPPAAPAS